MDLLWGYYPHNIKLFLVMPEYVAATPGNPSVILLPAPWSPVADTTACLRWWQRMCSSVAWSPSPHSSPPASHAHHSSMPTSVGMGSGRCMQAKEGGEAGNAYNGKYLDKLMSSCC